ncbi:LacI family transcriptional regulator [Puniceicoccales bacterium CK1056]|uniref:LacI family transcriptional regulator n=1 Tax=Oceanipulchritudo coccoides TaxID=2706888 RepID=A0A6B2LZI1_9BACT|nr:LacI family DNA-binding transcriptional regulator [Oceanipulchritudo coccoides]NDV62131.1 LacI family transcriptional regulator [Oceanipulchritudo coccoides]
MPEPTPKADTSASTVQGTAGLARHLGVSRWTISRVLNGHDGVKEETRKRVLAAVEDLGFEPNKLARGLRGVPSGLVGVSFPHLEAMVLAAKSQVIQQELKKAGYRAMFEMPEGDPDVEEAVVRHFLSINVDGIVLIGSTLEVDSPVFKEVKERGVGIVAVDPRHALPIPRVSLDRGKAMEIKLRHLHELGHKKIAVLGLSSDDMYQGIRKRGLRRAAGNLGLDFKKDLQFIDEPGYDQQNYKFGSLLARKVLEMGKGGPTALFCLNDRIAIGAMRGLQEAGKKIPQDYSIIGLDNLPETAWTNPPLTTVDQNIGKLMEKGQKALWTRDKSLKPPHYKVEPILVVRKSTGPC